MKLTFRLVAATNINTFNELITDHLKDGWRFVANQPMFINEHEDITGQGLQYSMPMLLEEQE